MRTLKHALIAVVTLLFSTLIVAPVFAGESGCVESVCRDVAELKNTYWKLVELEGTQITMAPQQRRVAHITLTAEGARLNAFGGCNQLFGGYLLEKNTLQFTQMAGTKMACEPVFMEMEDTFLKMLGATTGYRIEGQQLFLLGGDQLLSRFEAVYE